MRETETLEQAIPRHVLVVYMAELSEDYYCAGWMSHWENECRTKATRGENLVLDELQRLAGGWWPSSYAEASQYRVAQAIVERCDPASRATRDT